MQSTRASVGFVALTIGTVAAHAQTCIMRTVAGQPVIFSGDNGPAVSANFFAPRGLAFDSNGNLYVVDSRNRRVRVISPAGVVTTFAGTGEEGVTGDGGLAVRAAYSVPNRVVVDAEDNVYVSGDNRIRRVTRDGLINTIAGNGLPGFSGDGGPATQAELNDPEGMAFGPDGSLYVADAANHRIRRIAPDGTITTAAGASFPGLPPPPQTGIGDGGPATAAILFNPEAVAFDRMGRLYISDTRNRRIRRVDPDGTVRTIAGGGTVTNLNGPVGALEASLPGPASLALDALGNVYFTTFSAMYRLGTDGNLSPVSLGPGTSVLDDLTFDAAGNLYFSQVDRSQVIRRGLDGTLSTFAGVLATGFGGDEGPALGALLYLTATTATDRNGNLYFGDRGTRRIRKITPDGIIRTIAGADGTSPVTDGVPALSVPVLANALAADANGNVFVLDFPANRVYKLTPDGVIHFFAGNGQLGSPGDNSGEGMPATQLALSGTADIALDSAGNLYLAEVGRRALRRVVPDGTIRTFAPEAYQFSGAIAIATDVQGNLYALDNTNQGARIVKISGPTGRVLATLQRGLAVRGLAVDAGGNVYFGEVFNHRIRRVSPDGAVKTIAGVAYRDGFSGDGGPAGTAFISQPLSLSMGDNGTLYFADIGSDRVRAVSDAANCPGVSAPAFVAGNVTNLANTFARGGVAPGEPIRIFGLDFGPSTQIQALLTDGSLPTSLSGTRVMIDGVAAAIVAASSGEVIAVAPNSFAGTNTTQISVEYMGQASDPVMLPVEPAVPALFAASGGLTGSVTGQAAALSQDGSVNAPGNPASEGSVIALFGAGGGMMTPPEIPGTLSPMMSGILAQPVTVSIGGKAADVLYAGPAPGLLSGVFQVNARVPSGVASATGVLVSATIGAITSPLGVTLSVR